MSDAPLALVTGSGRGIGGAAVRCLLADGLRVIALDRSAQGLEELSGTLRSDALSTRAFDLSQTAQIPSLVKALLDKHGPITRLVNNAGTWVGGPILELDDRTWQTNFDVNVTAPFALMRGLVPAMIESGGGVGAGGGIGAIVNVSSRNAFRSSTNNAAYDASKAALVALTRTAAGEFAAHGVRVNAVCPGVVRTPGTPGTPEIDQPLFKAAYTKLIPMARYAEPSEIAAVIRFLLSDAASFMTGQAVVVDGGQIACQDNGRFMEVPGLERGVPGRP